MYLFLNIAHGLINFDAGKSFFNCVLGRSVYSDCAVQDLTQLHMQAVTCATRVVDAALNYHLETTNK
jgi:hypothetical protein